MRHEAGVIKNSMTFHRQWTYVTLFSALVLSLMDAALLQRSRGLFTGGFLSDDHLNGAGEYAAFIMSSLIVDAAVGGLLAATAMYLCGKLRTSRNVAVLAGLMAAVVPLAIVDATNYQITRFLGPAFDLSLMFDLSGRSVAEFWAVASSHLWAPLLALTGLLVVAGLFLWAVNRVSGPRASAVSARGFMRPIALAALGTIVLTVAVSARESLSNGLLRKPSGQALEMVVTLMSDVDGDGFGFIGRLADPNPTNGEVFPYAVDEPGNALDENGVGGDLPPDAAVYPERQVPEARFVYTPDVVLVVLESFRADLVGAELDEKPITPVMNGLAARGLSAPRAYSHNGYTVQSRFHLLTGTLVAKPESRSLIDDFKANGYLTASFSGQDELFGGREYRVGFDRVDTWFDARAAVDRRYTTFTTPGSLAVAHDVVQEKIDEFLVARAADARPLFMYVGYGDTHFPYTHRGIESLVSDVRLPREQISPGRRELLWASYANTAANVDRAIGVLLERVKRARGREPVIVITSDHGESLFDDGFLGHGAGLNDVQTRVPLIVANAGLRLPDPFSQIDLRSVVVDALTGTASSAERPSLIPTDRPVLQYLGDLRRPRQIAYLSGGKRFIYDFRAARAQLWSGEWQPPSALTGESHATFAQLIHQWEWISRSLRRGLRGDSE